MWGDPDWDEKTKHLSYVFKCFQHFGKLGMMGTNYKEKYGTPRWSVAIGSVRSIHDIVKAGHVAYRWSPEQGVAYILLDLINNWSKFFFALWLVRKVLFKWQMLCYNLAYWLPMLKYPDRAWEIGTSADYDELLWFNYRVWARRKGIEAGTLDWLLKREAEDAAKKEENNDV